MIEWIWEYVLSSYGVGWALIILFGVISAIIFGLNRKMEIAIPVFILTLLSISSFALFPKWLWYLISLMIGGALGIWIYNILR